MIKSRGWIIAAALAAATLANSANAAPVGQVIQQCDNMHAAGQTCNYGIKGNSLVGCTNNIVFECPADGSRQCTGGKNTTGKCNEDGTVQRVESFRGDALLDQLKALSRATSASKGN